MSCLALVDSGASLSVVSRRFAERLAVDILPAPRNLSLSAVNSDTLSVVGVVCLSVDFPNTPSIVHNFIVIDPSSSDVILGFDFVTEHGFSIDGAHHVLRIPNSSPVPLLSNSLIAAMSMSPEPLCSEQLQRRDSLISAFPELFDSNPGRTSLAAHSIETGCALPFKINRKPSSPADIAEADRQLDEMLRDDVIEPSSSPWSSPIIFVNKKDGTKRFAVDFRWLNNVTVKCAYPLPLQQELLDRLAGHRYYTALDLKSGFWQVPLNPRDREKTAFPTHRRLFHFKVMPFGLCNAPATFQSVMQQVLGPLLFNGALTYLDDVLVYSKTFDEHVELLRKVFERLREAGLKLQLKKCKFFQSSVRYLGHVISENGATIDPDKVTAISQFPRPNDASSLRRFNGMASYLRRFVPNFAAHSACLTKLVNAEHFEWRTEHEHAFNALKAAIASATELAFPHFDKPFMISADASDYALGAVLSQTQLFKGKQVDRPIAFASRTLTPTECNYPTYEKECLALVFATQQFRHYILGNKITFLSDHRPHQWLRSTQADPKKQSSRRIQRWQLWLEQFNFDVKYRRGCQQYIADALSRAPVAIPELDDFICSLTTSCPIDAIFPPTLNVIDLSANCKVETESILQLQLDDPVFGSILRQLSVNPRQRPDLPETASRDVKRLRDQFRHIVKRSGVWHLRARNGQRLLLLPSVLVCTLLSAEFDLPSSGHQWATKYAASSFHVNHAAKRRHSRSEHALHYHRSKQRRLLKSSDAISLTSLKHRTVSTLF